MEQEIKKWKNLWQEEKSTSIDFNSLLTQINSIEKKGKIERLALLMAFPVTIIVLGTILPIFSNMYYLGSVILVGIAMLMILIQTYRSRYDLINEKMLNNHTYLEMLIHKLRERVLTTSRYMWIYTFLLIIGLNIGYIDILKSFELPLSARVITHIVISIVMLYLMYTGIKKRKEKHKREIVPLIKVLESFSKEMIVS